MDAKEIVKIASADAETLFHEQNPDVKTVLTFTYVSISISSNGMEYFRFSSEAKVNDHSQPYWVRSNETIWLDKNGEVIDPDHDLFRAFEMISES